MERGRNWLGIELYRNGDSEVLRLASLAIVSGLVNAPLSQLFHTKCNLRIFSWKNEQLSISWK